MRKILVILSLSLLVHGNVHAEERDGKLLSEAEKMEKSEVVAKEEKSEASK